MKTLNEENSFWATVLKDKNTNLAKIWEEFEKSNRQLNSILEEEQTMRRDLRNFQKKKDSLRKQVYYLYEKEEKEQNFSPHTNQGDEPIIHNSQKVKEEEKS
ncbi:hypothetical protein O181_100019 [Austropuccinia psidii MF-1]|uniref:Uncharacterized protein n=1 Tax=Austropuccinia psidii MF-1 TaxID=1389203 RepID=A0A9Q3JEE1_9BASI|nr:hypothetical protein [Austropuccinia psidii MF-1]